MNLLDKSVILLTFIVVLSYYYTTRFNLKPNDRNPN
jgi:hypothetical protein